MIILCILLSSAKPRNLAINTENDAWVRDFLEKCGINPEELPPEKDLKIIERKLKSDEKKLWNTE